MAGAIKKLVKGVLILVVILLIAAFAFVYYVGAWNVIFPSTQHDSEAPMLPGDLTSPAVLVFSKTNQFRHKEGIEAGNDRLAQIAKSRGWALFSTENGAVFNDEDLQRFDTVVFLNTTGDTLSEAQEQVFQSWLEQGGGWIGVHAAGDGSHVGWQWYMDNLLGADFTAHIMGPQFQIANVVVEDYEHPVMSGLPTVWDHEEEWYSWEDSPRGRGFHVLAAIDEDSYTPVQKIFNSEVSLRMQDHPVVWTNCIGAGRTLYSAMGHQAKAFDQAAHRKLLENALAWTMGLTEGGCPADSQ